MIEKPVHILVVGHDPALRDEWDAAVEGLPARRVLVTYASGYAQAEDYARNRQPELVCVELTTAFQDLKLFAKELRRTVPAAVLAGLFWEDQLGGRENDPMVLIDYVRAGIQDFLRRPLSSTELRQLLDRLFTQRTSLHGTVGTVVSFVSNKGGVGKSTLAVNAAAALARRYPEQVLLIDASLQLGVCALMLDLVPATTIVDAVREKTRLDETMLRQLAVPHPCGLYLLAAPTNAVDASEVDEESVYRILNLARRAFPFVVVDTFPLLDSTVMAVLDVTDVGFIVMQGTAPSIVGMVKFLPMLKGLGFGEDRQRLVLNQNYRNFAGNLKLTDIERRLGRQLQYVFPYQKGILVAANAGEPYILGLHRYFGFGREMEALVDDIAEQQSARRGQLSANGAVKPAGHQTASLTEETAS
ncbi:AAA family ATPase [Candidatus Nitrospira inopinata]|uniref:Response regulator receiver protein n=1 Tax=Candidatus Nitrospira inopinata TaxID=1715989 RepID=A0A0S4KVR4_9BACT|nr:AAA family ATPase [Candidatus Nitrospira inopinata]CUQ67320.1 Response regulator receiver protein [Candidatus Nitrospira inopinata]